MVMLTKPSSGVCVNPCRRDSSRGSQGSGSLIPSLGMVTVPSCPPSPRGPTLWSEGDRRASVRGGAKCDGATARLRP